MQRLTGLDATFLYVETPTSGMHVAMTGIYDTSTMPDGYSFERFRQHIVDRFRRIPPMTRRLVEVPFQLHHPVWVEDPHFDIDYHVRRVAVPAPGGRRELADLAAQIASIPLNRKRPLWEVWVIEGLKQDRIAFVAKVHHAAIDGASGAEIMTELYDLEASPPPKPELDSAEPERIPTDLELVSYAVASKLRRGNELLPLVGRTMQGLSALINGRRDAEAPVGAAPLTAPKVPWNGALSSQRRVAFARFGLEETKAIRRATDTKVNDVVLAVCAGALRRYLEQHDCLPESPLVAVCPVSVRTEDEVGTAGNKVSAMFTALDVCEPDPLVRLANIAGATVGAKTEHNAVGARMLTDWGEYAAPRTFAMASRLYSSMGLADRHRPIHNLIISNVPGPPFPLYLAGAELVAAYPMGPVMEGVGLNITVMSYRDSIDVGFMVDRELVPDVWDLAAHVGAAFDELHAAATAGAEPEVDLRTTPPRRTAPTAKGAPAKRAPAKRAPAKRAPAKTATSKTATGATARKRPTVSDD